MITLYLESSAKSVSFLIHTVKIISPGGYLPKSLIHDPISRKIPADLAGDIILGPPDVKVEPLRQVPPPCLLPPSDTWPAIRKPDRILMVPWDSFIFSSVFVFFASPGSLAINRYILHAFLM